MGLCFIFSGSSVGAVGVGPCMGTKQSNRVASAITAAEISGCERTVPTLPSKAKVN